MRNEYEERVSSEEGEDSVLEVDTGLEESPQASDVMRGSVDANVTAKDSKEEVSQIPEPGHVVYCSPKHGYFQWEVSEECFV